MTSGAANSASRRIAASTFVRHVDFHSEIGSTNNRALEIAGTLPAFPALVWAERQTAGRGRGANRWWAGDGGLTFSVVFNGASIRLPTERWPLVSLVVGLAVAQGLEVFVPAEALRLKWPNDVFLDGRKVCGILVETALNQSGALVVGIGVNVNNSLRDAPPELQAIGISLRDRIGRELDRVDVLIEILRQLEGCLQETCDDFPGLAERWRARCFLHGRTVQIRTANVGGAADTWTGVCQSIDDDGALLLQTETGLARCISGVVTRIL